jgi:NAD+ synthase (glutamine-hydrolysing)
LGWREKGRCATVTAMRIAVAQLNPTIGDLAGNSAEILATFGRARDAGADLVVMPELAVSGYPPRDLLDRRGFVVDALATLRRLAHEIHGPALIVGGVVGDGDGPLVVESRIANGAVLVVEGKIRACHRKVLLPNYDVFDEVRYFAPGTVATVATLGGRRVGITICEDIWNDKDYWLKDRYEREPIAEQMAAGADLLINISASPYERDKPKLRHDMLCRVRDRHRRPVPM